MKDDKSRSEGRGGPRRGEGRAEHRGKGREGGPEMRPERGSDRGTDRGSDRGSDRGREHRKRRHEGRGEGRHDGGHAGRHGGRHGGHHGGHGRKRKRLFDYGELRLLVLLMIAEAPRHGYELIKQIDQRFDGAYSPSPGVIYPTLSWLEDMGYVTIRADDSNRKRAHITPEGQAFLTANRSQAEALLSRKAPMGGRRGPPEIMTAMEALKGALKARLAEGAETETGAEAVTRIAGRIQDLANSISAEARGTTARTEALGPVITRHRHETRRRKLTVRETGYLTPHMIRMELEGEDLADFVSLGFDDHIKLFFQGEDGGQEMRDYTPRRYDPEARRLTLDFAVHDAGPATAWALGAKPGDTLEIGGPRGSSVISQVFDWWLLIGDETALPAIGRQIEELPAYSQVVTLVAVPGPDDEQSFAGSAELRTRWVHRPAEEAADPQTMLDAARGLTLPAGRGFIWIAAEAKVARALRDHFAQDRGHPREWMKASGYWVEGNAATSDKKLG